LFNVLVFYLLTDVRGIKIKIFLK